MLKVLLIISAMGIEQTMEFPDMETCLEVRSSIMMQNENAEALCIPAGAEDLTMKRMDRFFDKFMEMVERLEHRQLYEDLGETLDLDELE
jgi:hypothetical protein|tara:strand:+ start:993 stop:1262 length:270 start_codon:yes stop_codon:yes gene_type:complete